ncbi:hypothetical protein DFH09DRAFT_1354955 [Mycena vulgaris]|nr:hypothetical protein DFH09DRAFT_1354955 [Mycena vulgaris]
MLPTLYALVYNLCHAGQSQALYDHIVRFFADHTAQIAAGAPTGGVVAYYNIEWDRFSSAFDVDIDTIVNVALRTWKGNVLEALAGRLREELQGKAGAVDTLRVAFASRDLTAGDFKDMHLGQRSAEV